MEQVKELVFEILGKDTSGHNIDHVMRVYNLAMKFAVQEKANTEIVALAALLHDVDDYKLVGHEKAEKLQNAHDIMAQCDISPDVQDAVVDIIKNMGYSKYLRGIRPSTLEGKILSDADMCDAIGANGIISSIVYAVSPKGSGTIFDPAIFPNLDITADEYNGKGTTHSTDNAINHFFGKLFKIKSIMMTAAGKSEAQKRHKIMVDFLENLFTEENVSQDWFKLLDGFR